MKKVTLYIDDKYADLISVTAVGTEQLNFNKEGINASTIVLQLKEENVFKICSDGSARNLREIPDIPR